MIGVDDFNRAAKTVSGHNLSDNNISCTMHFLKVVNVSKIAELAREVSVSVDFSLI